MLSPSELRVSTSPTNGRHGYEISPGTLYPILREMEQVGWLAREDRLVDGRVRKYYRATEAGRSALRSAK